MNLDIYFYMGDWFCPGDLFQMLSILGISYGEYQDSYVLRAYPLPPERSGVNRRGPHPKKPWLWLQKFG